MLTSAGLERKNFVKFLCILMLLMGWTSGASTGTFNLTGIIILTVCCVHLLSGGQGTLQTQSDGKTRLMEFVDEKNMARLYEKFILNTTERSIHILMSVLPGLCGSLMMT